MKHGLTLLATLMVLASCGGGSDMVSTPAINIAGSWNATMTSTGGSELPVGTQYGVAFTLTQNGGSVSGTWASGGGAGGTISGTISDNNFTFTGASPSPCVGSFSGTGTVNGTSTSISGAYSGSDCNGTFAVSFVASKA